MKSTTRHRDSWINPRLKISALWASMLFLSLVLPVGAARMANIVLAAVHLPTIVGGAVGEWNYVILGSAIEAALLVGVV